MKRRCWLNCNPERISAALDVFDQEPLPDDSPFRNLDNLIITPHISSVTRSSFQAAGRNHRRRSGELPQRRANCATKSRAICSTRWLTMDSTGGTVVRAMVATHSTWTFRFGKTLDGKTIIVTGASSGFGEAIALACAEAGAKVSLVARRKDLLESVAAAARGERRRRPWSAQLMSAMTRKSIRGAGTDARGLRTD